MANPATRPARWIVAGICALTGCGTSPISPTASRPPVTASLPTPPPPGAPIGPLIFPALTQPARVYQAPLLASRYVLYDDGDFALQFATALGPLVEYIGTYTETAGRITFMWEGWSVAGPWEADGTVTEETLTVTYNAVMVLSDFVSGAYQRVR